MDTTQVTQVPGSQVSASRRWVIALIAALALAAALAVAIRATARPAASTHGFTPVTIAPGHVQPATTIHRIAMQPTSQQGG